MKAEFTANITETGASIEGINKDIASIKERLDFKPVSVPAVEVLKSEPVNNEELSKPKTLADEAEEAEDLQL